MTTTSADTLLSIRQVADELAMCDESVYRLVRSGRIEAYRIGPKLLRVPRSALERFVRGEAASR